MANAYNVIASALANASSDKYKKGATSKALSEVLKTAEKSNMPDYDSMLPKELNVEAKIYNEKTQDELLSEAKNIVKESYADKIKKIEDSYKNKINTLTLKNENKDASFTEKTDKATEKYVSDTENATFKAIKNGIANSSVIGGYLENLNKSYIDDVNKITNEYTIFKENIDRELEQALNAKTQALVSYDIKAAADIEKKVIALKNEQSKAIEEINKYNRQLLEDKKSFQSDREQTLENLIKAWERKQK